MPNIWTGSSKLKTFTCGCNIKQLKLKKIYETKHECYNLLNLNLKNNAKMHAFSSDQATSK